jgi:ADP-ribose pyrophosphatase YjhB (NUDIX family)
VHLGEPRQRAAARKLLEECGLTVSELQESGTFDVIFPQTSWGAARHGITTLYHARVPNGLDVTIDSQSLEARWRSPAAWLETPLSLFVRERLRAFQEASHA